MPVSFPRSVGQEPLYYNQKNTGRPSNAEHVTYSHYTDVAKDALYPFGFGLSYTTFKYGDIAISSEAMNAEETLTVTIPVTNTGKVAGKEVVQLYLHDLVGTTTRPVKELKGFEMISLQPGETKNVSFTITEKMLQYYTANKIWESEVGDFDVMIGGNSKDLKKITFSLN